jgi:LytS/YehU family sensor histidine kinase
MMSRLSDLLRLSLEDESVQETTLNHELEFINGYLEIEQVRFADRLKVVYDIAPETLDALVPHLLLQPLAENAVRHGISKRASQGEIVIKARFENEHLYLSVRDNGPGLVPSASNGGRSGLGLRATRDRLRSLYGDDQRFDLHAASGGGAEAEIWIPFRPDTRQLLYGPERALPQPVA